MLIDSGGYYTNITINEIVNNNIIKEKIKIRDSPKITKKLNLNQNSLTKNIKNKIKKLSSNNKIIHSSSSKNYLNNTNFIEQKIHHIKTLSDIDSIKNIKNKLNTLNIIHNENNLSKSPVSNRSNINNEFKSSIVKITLVPENFFNVGNVKKNLFN